MIVFIDDEPRFMDSYVDYLNNFSDYKVKEISSVDEAAIFLGNEANSTDLQLLIIDVMMPPGETFKSVDTKKGLRTGEFLYYKIREEHPQLPIIIFTNVSDPEFKKKFESEKMFRFMRKEDYRLKEFLEEIDLMVKMQPSIQ
jgi:DNA-binding NarL/FixJ family response regulator